MACKIARNGEAAYETFLRLTESERVVPDDVFMKMLNDILTTTGRNDLRKAVYEYFVSQENKVLKGAEPDGPREDRMPKEERVSATSEDEEGEEGQEEYERDDEEEGDEEEDKKDPLTKEFEADSAREAALQKKKNERTILRREAKKRRRQILHLKKQGYKPQWVMNEDGRWVEEFPVELLQQAEKDAKEDKMKTLQEIEQKKKKKLKQAEKQSKEDLKRNAFNRAGFIKARMVTTSPTQEW